MNMSPLRQPLADKDPAGKENVPTTAPDALEEPATIEDDAHLGDDVDESYQQVIASAKETMGNDKWDEFLRQLSMEPDMLDLHSGLTEQKLAVELEQQLERLVKDGDPLLVELKRMAATVDGMPMAPLLVMMLHTLDSALRVRRVEVSTQLEGGSQTAPFKGTSADYNGICGECAPSPSQP